MRNFSFLTLLLFSSITNGQDREKIDAELFRTIICNEGMQNRDNVFYASVLGIDKYEFYQDSKSFDETYKYKSKNVDADPLGGQIIDLSISHYLVINHYDKSPFKVISNHSSVDTSEINKFLNTFRDYRNKTKIWTQFVYKCNNVNFIKRFRPKMIRVLFNQNCTFVSTPIIFNQDKLAIIKVTRIKFGSTIKEDKTKIYFLENINANWTINDIFTVTKTSPLTITVQ